MNKTMLEGPENWICNARVRHGPGETISIHTPIPKIIKLDCQCLVCLVDEGRIENFELKEPVELSHSFPVKKLKKLGYVGIFKKANGKVWMQ